MKNPFMPMTPEEFFWNQAGWSWKSDETQEHARFRCAQELARAEQGAKERNWECVWEIDDGFDWRGFAPDGADDGCCAWCNEPLTRRGECANEHVAWGAMLRDADGEVLASLWGIVDPDNNYQRVVAAELASEAIANEEVDKEIDRLITRRDFAL